MKKAFFILLAILIISISGCKKEPPANMPTEQAQVDNMYMISHSEYWSDENGQIIARLLNYKGEAIVDANCTIDILYPNKTYFKQNEAMNFSIDSYYYMFITPSFEGVYEYKATCSFNNNTRTQSVMNSFHLSPALNFIAISHDDLSGKIANLTDLNNANFGNITYNLSQIKLDTEYIRENMVLNITAAQYQSEVMAKLNILSGYCNDTDTSSSYLCQWVNETRVRLLNMNISVENYLSQINVTTVTTAQAIAELNQTVVSGGFTAQDRYMLEKIYNCTIFGIGCHLTEASIWNYSGRYTNGEEIQ
jgi:hypothetical protein